MNDEMLQYIRNESFINEVYFGKTSGIQKIEAQLSKFRNKYINTKNRPNSDPDLLKLNRLVEDQFGFGCFSLVVDYHPIPAASTIPIDFSFNAAKKRDSYMVDKNTYKFKKEYDYTCIVSMTTGLIFNDYFTDEEVMACLLSELGMNFYMCFEERNAVLSNIYNATAIANTVVDTILLFKSAKEVSDAIQSMSKAANYNDYYNRERSRFINLHKLSDEELKDPNISKIMDMTIKQNVDDAFEMSYKNSLGPIVSKLLGSGIGIGYIVSGLIGLFKKSIVYKKILDNLNNKFAKEKDTEKLVYDSSDYIKLALGVIGSNIDYGFNVAARVLSTGQKITVSSVISALNIRDLLIPYKKAINRAKNPLSWITLGVNYNVERAADNFPTMYGYGAAEISFYDKMKSKDKVKYVGNILDKAPIMGILFDTILLPTKILTSVFDPSPSGISKSHNQIKLLKAELSKENLDPKMKKHILTDLALCEKNIKKLTDASNGVSDPELYRHLYNKVMTDFFNGVGFKDVIFDSGDRFSRYDTNINELNNNKQISNESFTNNNLDIEFNLISIGESEIDDLEILTGSFIGLVLKKPNEAQIQLLQANNEYLITDETYADWNNVIETVIKYRKFRLLLINIRAHLAPLDITSEGRIDKKLFSLQGKELSKYANEFVNYKRTKSEFKYITREQIKIQDEINKEYLKLYETN